MLLALTVKCPQHITFYFKFCNYETNFKLDHFNYLNLINIILRQNYNLILKI